MPSQTFPFFSLPRELRDLIYNFLWSSYPSFIIPYSGKRSLLVPNITHAAQVKTRFPEEITYLPPWLFTNQSFFMEAASALKDHSEWVYYSSETYRPNSGSAVLFGPQTSKTVTVILGAIAGFQGKLFKVYANARFVKDFAINLSRIAEDMLACERAQRLCLWFDDNQHSGLPGLKGDEIEIGIFDVFQHVPIESLVIFVEGQYDDGVVKLPEQRQHLWAGLERVAAAVLGVEEPKKSLEKHWKTAAWRYDWLEYNKVV